MGDIIYWKQYDEPKQYSHTHKWVKDGIEKSFIDSGKVSGEFVCVDDRVESFFMHGSLTPKNEAIFCAELKLKSGERKSFASETNDHPIENLISQAEEYLKSLK